MFFFRKSNKQQLTVKPGYENVIPLRRSAGFSMEGLEDRQLLSASVLHHYTVAASATAASTASVKHHSATASSSTTTSDTQVLFSAAPAAVQTGLQALAPTGTTLSATQKVEVRTLGDGSIIYSTRVSSTGVVESLTVDATGAAVTTPVGGHFGGGCGGDHGGATATTLAAVSSTISAALQAQAPAGVTLASTQAITVHADRSGNTIYSTSLLSGGTVYILSVDSTGATVTSTEGTNTHGGTATTYSAVPAAVQTGISTLAGGITIAGTQAVTTFTESSGTTVYSTTLRIAGVVERITVDGTGAAVAFGDGEGFGGHGHHHG